MYKSQEEGYILTEIPLRKVLAGTQFRTFDLPTQSDSNIFVLQEITTQLYPISKAELFSVLHSTAVTLKLDLSLATEITTDNFVSVFTTAQKPDLRNLTLTLNELTNYHLEVISATCPSLVTLAIDESGSAKQASFFQASAAAIACSFEACPELKTLKITTIEGQRVVESINAYPYASQVVALLHEDVVIIRRQDSSSETLNQNH